jgi:hypothetical protein
VPELIASLVSVSSAAWASGGVCMIH